MFALALLLQVQAAPVQLGATVRPETVTVGQHFVATIRVRAPAGSDLRFPATPDSTSHVDTAAPVRRVDASGAGYTEATVTYALAAWDTGSQALGLGNVVVATASGERLTSLGGLRVYVRSVLPADTALRKPKPFRDLIAVKAFNWLPWAIAAAAAIVAALLAYAWWRWRKRPKPAQSPLQWAQREFARVDAQRMLESGETERYAIAIATVVRGYLSRAIPALHQSLTTRELADVARGEPSVPQDRVTTLLERADLLKFAAAHMAVADAHDIGVEARALVASIDAAIRAAATTTPQAVAA